MHRRPQLLCIWEIVPDLGDGQGSDLCRRLCSQCFWRSELWAVQVSMPEIGYFKFGFGFQFGF